MSYHSTARYLFFIRTNSVLYFTLAGVMFERKGSILVLNQVCIITFCVIGDCKASTCEQRRATHSRDGWYECFEIRIEFEGKEVSKSFKDNRKQWTYNSFDAVTSLYGQTLDLLFIQGSRSRVDLRDIEVFRQLESSTVRNATAGNIWNSCLE